MTDWEGIAARLGEILRSKRPLEWCHLDSLRCVVMPKSEEQSTKLLNLRQMRVNWGDRVELSKWSPEVYSTDCYEGHRKVGIQGLPLHLWSLAFLRAIVGLCDGFMKVDEETKHWRSLQNRSAASLNIMWLLLARKVRSKFCCK